MRALARLRGDLAFTADRPQHHVEAPLPRRRPAFELEHRMRESFNFGLDALDEVGEPVDDGFEQSGQHGCAAGGYARGLDKAEADLVYLTVRKTLAAFGLPVKPEWFPPND